MKNNIYIHIIHIKNKRENDNFPDFFPVAADTAARNRVYPSRR